jgi:hypothetical protein
MLDGCVDSVKTCVYVNVYAGPEEGQPTGGFDLGKMVRCAASSIISPEMQ